MKVIIVLSVAAAALAINPAVYVQLNQQVFEYGKNVGLAYLRSHVHMLHIPDLSGSSSHLDWQLHGLQITGLEIADDKQSVTLAQPHGLDVRLGEATLSLHASYHVTFKLGFIHISKGGSVDVRASLNADINTQVTDAAQRPVVTLASCVANIYNVDITLHGNLLDKIIDLFKSEIEHAVTDKLRGLVCEKAHEQVTQMVNPKLQRIPISLDVYKNFSMDVALTANPGIVGQTLMVPFLGRVWVTGHHDDPAIPAASAMGPVANANKHVCVKADIPSMVADLIYAANVTNQLTLDVSEKLLAKYNMSGFLACDCDGGNCVGTYIPAIRQHCSANASYAALIVGLGQTPTLIINATGVYTRLDGVAALTIEGHNLLTMDVSAGVRVSAAELKFDGWAIKGGVHSTGGDLKVTSSMIGNIPQVVLDAIYHWALKFAIDSELNQYFEAGFALPPIPDVTVLEPAIQLAESSLQLCANVHVTPPQ